MAKYVLKLYIFGDSTRSRRAVANLQRICAEALDDECSWEMIDISENPDVAEEKKILATPTLIKVSPPPVRRIIGDLSDTNQLLLALDLPPNLIETEKNTEKNNDE